MKLNPHVYVDIYTQLLLLFSLCVCTKACRLQILTVIILGHSSLTHVFLSYFLFKIQFCANRHTSIYLASSLIAELTWLVPGFQDFMGYVSRIGGYTLDSAVKFFCNFFFLVIIACLFAHYWLFKLEGRSNERHLALFPALFLRGEPPLQSQPQTLVLSFDAPPPHGWLVLRHWARIPIHPSIAWSSGDGRGAGTQCILLNGETCQAGW